MREGCLYGGREDPAALWLPDWPEGHLTSMDLTSMDLDGGREEAAAGRAPRGDLPCACGFSVAFGLGFGV